jgi:hypothetical protein
MRAEKGAGAQEPAPTQAAPSLPQEPAPLSTIVSDARAQAENGSASRETKGRALEQVITHQGQIMAEQLRLQSHILGKQLEILKSRIKGA